MIEALEPKWIDSFQEFFELSGIGPGDLIGVLAESQSRTVLVELSEHALYRIGARPVRVTVPSPRLIDPLPVRSTGATYAYDDYPEIMEALGCLQPRRRLHGRRPVAQQGPSGSARCRRASFDGFKRAPGSARTLPT